MGWGGILIMTFKEVFSAEGPFSRVGSAIFEIFYVNILWLVFGGPFAMVVINYLPFWNGTVGYIAYWVCMIAALLHMGPATAAAFSAVGKRQRHEETYTFRDFWHSYKQNYKQGLIVMLIFTIALGLIAYAIWLEVVNMELYGKMLFVVIPVQGLVLIELIFCLNYIFALLARFEMPTKDLFRNAFLMANKHLPSTVVCVLLFAACIAGFLFWNMGTSFFMPGIYFYLAGSMLERVFRNYMPDEDESFEKEEVEGYDIDAERQAIIDRYTGKLNQSDEEK